MSLELQNWIYVTLLEELSSYTGNLQLDNLYLSYIKKKTFTSVKYHEKNKKKRTLSFQVKNYLYTADEDPIHETIQ